MLNKHISNIMACPKCKNNIEHDKNNKIIICRNCNLTFIINQNIPLMLVDEAQQYK
jgi:uncharacterized protein